MLAGPLPAGLAARRQVVGGLDGASLPVRWVGSVTLLPQLGGAGALVDYEYAARLSGPLRAHGEEQVWLAAGTPASLVDRLVAGGLTVLGERGTAGERAAMVHDATAAALRFYLVAALLAVALGSAGLAVVAAVDRRGRAAELAALRVQGLSAQTASAAALAGNGLMVAVAVVAGTAAGLLGWALSRTALPLVTDPRGAALLPAWSPPGFIAAAVALATAVLLTGAAIAAHRVAATVTRIVRGGAR